MKDISYDVYMDALKKIPNWKRASVPLNEQEKNFIRKAIKEGASKVAIARVLNRNRNTITDFMSKES
jgi:ribosomal protein L31E